MTGLENLNLTLTKITDAGLPQLKNLANLKTLNLNQTKVGKDAAAQLRGALPNCKITRD